MHLPRPARALADATAGLRARSARRRRAAPVLTIGLITLASLTVPASPATAAPAPTLPARNSHGLTVTRWEPLNPFQRADEARVLEATVETDAIFRPGTGGTPSLDDLTIPIKVRIYLPANYRSDPANPYPVLYLLHGGADDAAAWTDKGKIAEMVRRTPFRGIVVMPEGGRAGWYTDWYGETDGHFAPMWETFHIEQLLPWIDANFNTIDHRSGRSIAGLSMGGLGTLMYAGRHTDLFSAVGSFSGGTDLREEEAQATIDNAMWQGGAATSWHGLLDGKYRVTGTREERVTTVFGPTAGWGDVNPYQMANRYNAYDTTFGLYSGQHTDDSNQEHRIGVWNTAFHEELVRNGVDHRYCTGTGTHDWEYWQEDLVDFLHHVYGSTPTSCPNGWPGPET